MELDVVDVCVEDWLWLACDCCDVFAACSEVWGTPDGGSWLSETPCAALIVPDNGTAPNMIKTRIRKVRFTVISPIHLTRHSVQQRFAELMKKIFRSCVDDELEEKHL